MVDSLRARQQNKVGHADLRLWKRLGRRRQCKEAPCSVACCSMCTVCALLPACTVPANLCKHKTHWLACSRASQASVAYYLMADNRRRMPSSAYLKEEMTEATDPGLAAFPSGVCGPAYLVGRAWAIHACCASFRQLMATSRSNTSLPPAPFMLTSPFTSSLRCLQA